MPIRRLIPSVVRWSIWPLRWSTGEDTHRVQTGGLWEFSWYGTPHTHTHTKLLETKGCKILLHLLLHFLLLCLQFEMLTGTLPFQGKDRNETMNMILKLVVKRVKVAQKNLSRSSDESLLSSPF